MVLVRDNCLQYNPIGTDVRRDCEEVFAFYLQEYDKALVKWQQVGFVHVCGPFLLSQTLTFLNTPSPIVEIFLSFLVSVAVVCDFLILCLFIYLLSFI